MSFQNNLEKIVRKVGVPPEKARDTIGVAAIAGSMIAMVATGFEHNPDTFVQGMEFLFEVVAFGYGGVQIEHGTFRQQETETRQPIDEVMTSIPSE